MTERRHLADEAPRAGTPPEVDAALSQLPPEPAEVPVAPAPLVAVPPDERLPPEALDPPGATTTPPMATLVTASTTDDGGPLPVAQAIADGRASDPIIDTEVVDDEAFPWLTMTPSWLTSTVVHLALVLILALLTTTRALQDVPPSLTISADGDAGGDPDLESELMEIPATLDTGQALAPQELSDLPAPAALNDSIGPISATLNSGDLDPKLAGGAGGTAIEGDGLPGGTGEGNALELRLSGASRAAMVKSGGGTPESERAVERALHWLAEHQFYDGSWSYEHHTAPRCHGKCGEDGFNPSRVAATAMALLPFLGTGQTHREGPYKKNIDLGLKYLVRVMQAEGSNGSLWDDAGTMYAHGLASIALCEAYGMTHDQQLQGPAQSVVNFIVFAQDPEGGGWRYQPQTPGDTSVVGWQLMALKSAQMAYLKVPPHTMKKAGYFLDKVQAEKGAVYGYLSPEGRRPATTAIGLLCRMYLGWKHEQLPLQHGVQILGQLGPSTDRTGNKNNMYYNYYATQVMHHYGGYPWQRWNAVMREYLIKSQETKGHEAGSWYLPGSDDGSRAGGRLYCTAMAAMTLEVYYRYMPLYRPQSTDAD